MVEKDQGPLTSFQLLGWSIAHMICDDMRILKAYVELFIGKERRKLNHQSRV